MPAISPTVALFTRFPDAGKAKTRLIPALGAEGAARVHRLLVERTLATVRATGLPFRLHVTGAPTGAFTDWLGADITFVEQGEGDLGARLASVSPPAILLGADVPDLAGLHLAQAALALEKTDAVIGPAEDGGYYLLGLRRPLPFLFGEMPWGTQNVLSETLKRLTDTSTGYTLLETLADCDRPADLARWPELLR